MGHGFFLWFFWNVGKIHENSQNPIWGTPLLEDHIRDAYDLEKVLGKGSCGVVYKAQRRSDAQTVVVKVRNVFDKDSNDRFLWRNDEKCGLF